MDDHVQLGKPGGLLHRQRLLRGGPNLDGDVEELSKRALVEWSILLAFLLANFLHLDLVPKIVTKFHSFALHSHIQKLCWSGPDNFSVSGLR